MSKKFEDNSISEQSKLSFVFRILETQLNYVIHYDSRCNYLLIFYIAFISILTLLVIQTNLMILKILYYIVLLFCITGVVLILIAVAPFSRHPKAKGFTIPVKDQRFKDVTFYQGIRQYNSIEEYTNTILNKCSDSIDSIISEFSAQIYIVSGLLKKKIELISISNYLAIASTIIGSIMLLLKIMLK